MKRLTKDERFGIIVFRDVKIYCIILFNRALKVVWDYEKSWWEIVYWNGEKDTWKQTISDYLLKMLIGGLLFILILIFAITGELIVDSLI